MNMTTQLVNEKLFRSWLIDAPESDDSKEERGRVLAIGGDREIPGAITLTGIAALRAGAGKLQIATSASAAIQIGLAVPEARVIGLEEAEDGAIRGSEYIKAVEAFSSSDAAVIGSGMMNAHECAIFLAGILPNAGECTVVLDAGALSGLGKNPALLPSMGLNGIITPHAGEMASIIGGDIDDVMSSPVACASSVATALGVTVVLKGADTHIVSPAGEAYTYSNGDVGLATSGSGDVLAGVIAGLAARMTDSLRAAVCGVFIHGEAGNARARKSGRVGYLARELLPEIPPILNRLIAISG